MYKSNKKIEVLKQDNLNDEFIDESINNNVDEFFINALPEADINIEDYRDFNYSSVIPCQVYISGNNALIQIKNDVMNNLSCFIVRIEDCVNPLLAAQETAKLGVNIGFSINIDTPLCLLDPVLANLDVVLLTNCEKKSEEEIQGIVDELKSIRTEINAVYKIEVKLDNKISCY